MSMAARKLQTEIDRTLKRVSEGIELFEETYQKLLLATNATSKDKCETDLKTQIKKLQRLRDQIKAWQGGSEVKDKTTLVEGRKAIETQMERFKALEKEMKTKAFSKEGLIAATRLDPASQAKLETRHLLEEFVDSLNRQIEGSEAEIEVLQAQAGKTKKSGGKGAGKMGELERLNERRVWHVGKLEAVMRMLENGGLSVEQVKDLKEDVSYFVESNQEEDFEEDEGIYDDLHLEEEEEAYALQVREEDKDDADDDSVSEENTRTPAKPARGSSHPPEEAVVSPPSPVAAKKTPVRKATMESKFPEPTAAAKPSPTARTPAVPTPAVPTPTTATRQPSVPLPPIKYAAMAAAAAVPSAPVVPPPAPVSAPAPAPVATPAPAPIPEEKKPEEKKPEEKKIVSTMPSPAPHLYQNLQQAQVSPGLKKEVEASPTPERPSVGELSASSPHQSPPAQTPVPSPRPHTQLPTIQSLSISDSSQAQHPAHADPSPQFSQSQTQAEASSSRNAMGQAQLPPPPGMGAPQQQQVQQVQHTPNALSDLMAGFESVKQRSADRLADLDGLHAALDTGLASAPEPRDSERPRYYHPRRPYQTPPYYPQQPHPVLDDKTLYSRMDLDTLFFIFYYRTNTYEQWCAARELKRQSWRFHKQYLTWFQRLSQPQAITDEYEQGMYIYFDWENTWCQRKKSDFRFEYRWLSED